MKINETKINELEQELELKQKKLQEKLKARVSATGNQEEDKLSLDDIQNRRAALSQIVRRNILNLDHVKTKVFVSTYLEDGGQPPEWIKRILSRVNETRHPGEGKFEFIFGKAEEGDSFLKAILEKIVESSIFLSVVTSRPKKRRRSPTDLVSEFLSEEAGAAFALAKPMVVAVERGVDPLRIGRLFGNDWQRVMFSKTPDGEAPLASALRDALERAPRNQAAAVQSGRKIVAQLFR